MRDERGQVLVLTLLSMTVLMGFTALAVDTGVLFQAKRNMQIAADGAAMAGAVQLYYGPATQVQKSTGKTIDLVKKNAWAVAKLNGVDYTVSGNTVQIDYPPVDGPNTGCGSCVEARVAMPNPTVFMRMFGKGSISVAARAVAGAPGTSDACVWVMNPSLSGSLDLSGAGAVNAGACGIYVNSKSSTAVTYNNGHTGNVQGASLTIAGNDTAAKTNLTAISVGINAPPESPDLPDVPDMPSSGCSWSVPSGYSEVTVSTDSSSKGQISVATIASHINTTGGNNVICFPNSTSIDTGVSLIGALGNGVQYVFQNGVSLPNGAVQFGCYGSDAAGGCGAAAQGTTTFDPAKTYGATVDLYGGGLSQQNNQLSIYAPTSGDYNSVALMQAASNTNNAQCPANKSPDNCLLVQRGSSNSVFDGIIYAPKMSLEIQDGGGGVVATGVISDELYAKGSGTLNIYGYSAMNPNTTPFKLVTLVE
jgi:hypothetical protein